jgi:hypothetical protein
MAKSLTVADNCREYDINGKVTVRFNPTDESFVAKLEDTFGTMSEMQQLAESGNGFAKFADLDVAMRAKIDDLLGEGVSQALFGGMNCWALADGLPVWMNLILALLDEVSEAYEQEFGKSDSRVKAHNAKYEAMMAKYRKKGK